MIFKTDAKINDFSVYIEVPYDKKIPIKFFIYFDDAIIVNDTYEDLMKTVDSLSGKELKENVEIIYYVLDQTVFGLKKAILTRKERNIIYGKNDSGGLFRYNVNYIMYVYNNQQIEKLYNEYQELEKYKQSHIDSIRDIDKKLLNIRIEMFA